MRWFRSKQYPLALLILFLGFFVITAFHPLFLKDFILENVLTALFLCFLISTYRSLRLSNLSYTFIFIFLLFHTIGAHYTYSNVPYEDWFQSFFGVSINSYFGFMRNHYDRFVHFMFGFFMVYPLREVLITKIKLRGFWSFFLPLTIIATCSLAYELIEWGAALIFGGDLGIAYIGVQGDVWDTQKDMAFALLGNVVSSLGIFYYTRKKQN